MFGVLACLPCVPGFKKDWQEANSAVWSTGAAESTYWNKLPPFAPPRSLSGSASKICGRPPHTSVGDDWVCADKKSIRKSPPVGDGEEMSYIRLKQASHLLCLLLGLSEGRYTPVSANTLASTEVQDNPLPASRKLHQATAPAAAALPVNTSRFYSSDLDEPDQRQALLDLYASTAGPDWTVPYVSATSSREGSLGAAPTSAALETDNATFLAEQLSNFEWGAAGISYCLWQASNLLFSVIWRKWSNCKKYYLILRSNFAELL